MNNTNAKSVERSIIKNSLFMQ